MQCYRTPSVPNCALQVLLYMSAQTVRGIADVTRDLVS